MGEEEKAKRGWQARWRALRDRDHTRGSLFASMLVLALPMVLGSLAAGVVYPLVDLSFLVSLGEDSLASVVIVNQTVWQIVIMGFMGMNFATQSHVSRWVGAARPDEAEHVAGQALLLAGAIGVVVGLCGLLLPEWLHTQWKKCKCNNMILSLCMRMRCKEKPTCSFQVCCQQAGMV